MSWLKKLFPSKIRTENGKKSIPEGLWTQCISCQAVLFRAELDRNLEVCPKCNYHMRISARKRLAQLLDTDTQEELEADLKPVDFIGFKDTRKYKERISSAQKKTKENDAFILMKGKLNAQSVILGAFEFGFIGGSMGSVVGEKITRGMKAAIANRIPFISVACSGGARMQESLISLMQMSKTAAARALMAEARLPFISVMVDPCTGGVSASFAMLGDIHIAEPRALIGFAGPRVIEQTVRETLPEGFQRSEFLLEKGAIDMIVDRRELKQTLARLLSKLTENKTVTCTT